MSIDNCFCCDGKSFIFIPYDNHLSSPKKTFKQLIRRILYLIIPKSFLYRINNRLCNEALLGVWATNKIMVCDNCGAGQIKKIPHEKEMNLWFNTKGNVTKRKANIDFKKGVIRSKSQFDYLSRYINIADIRNSLEYGSGIAALSRLLKKELSKITTTTVEISDSTNRILKNTEYINKVCSNLNINDCFDIIFCSHILPFVVDFQTVWATLLKKLTRGGYIFIEASNSNKEYYEMDSKDHPYHYFFSSLSIKKLAIKSGLNIVDISHFGYTWPEYVIHKKGKRYFENNEGIFLRSILQKP